MKHPGWVALTPPIPDAILKIMLPALNRGFYSLLFPGACLACAVPLSQGPEAPLCPDCFNQLPWSKPPWCQTCGRSLHGLGEGVLFCLECRVHPPAFRQAVSPFLYQGPIRALIQAFKYRGRLSIDRFLSRLMARTLEQRFNQPDWDAVVPVPLHATRLRERTFNQSEVLAKALSAQLRLRLCKNGLMRCKPTHSQSRLDRTQRKANVRKAFTANPRADFREKHLLLVDDVLTTGATAEACVAALRRAGAASVTVATLARG